MIARFKTVDCCRCGASKVPGKKRGKDELCNSCCKKDDAKKQLSKQRDYAAVRSLAPQRSDKDALKVVASSAETNRWFIERRKEMTGRCWNCGGKSCRDNDTYYKFSIAHLLPKKLFKSVRTHPLNWIELCHFGKSCHANMDNHMIDLIELNCFDEVIKRFVAMYPEIAQEEKRFIPNALLQYVEVEK